MEEHMDWHFRVNRRLRDVTKRAPSRDWYLDADEFVAQHDPEDQGKL